MQPIIIHNAFLNQLVGRFLDVRVSVLRTTTIYAMLAISLLYCGLEWLVMKCVSKIRNLI